MNVLAIDTVANLCAACIFDAAAGRALAAESVDIGRGHVEHLMPQVADVLEKSGCRYSDLDRIAVGCGPGSFTGVRVGVAAARGLSLALKVPAVGVSTLAAIAEQSRPKAAGREILVAIDARREEIYSAVFDGEGNCLQVPAVSTVEIAAEYARKHNPVLAGNAAKAIADETGLELGFGLIAPTSSVETIARIGALASPEANPAIPAYLRAPDAKPQTGFAVARAQA
ncbi:MAG: tRNA (adenosine(37)-N6)-threonylcarbamoyltransferase complex dimerization subunit type 1 TsaB [Rhizobiaceae bacterium]